MDLILDKIENKGDKELLQEWYVKDVNADPPEYVLQEITKDLGHEKNEEDISTARKKWQDAEPQLKGYLRECVKQCLEDDNITKHDAEKYFWSGNLLAI